MFLPPGHFYAAHESLLFGFALIVTDRKLLIFFSRPVITCGCVGPVAITVLNQDGKRQHGPFYLGRRLSQYRFLFRLTHSGCFGQHYFHALTMDVAVAQRTSNLFFNVFHRESNL